MGARPWGIEPRKPAWLVTRAVFFATRWYAGGQNEPSESRRHPPTIKMLWLEVLLLLSRFSRVRLCVTPETAAHQAPPVRFLCSWDFPGKNTGVSCHFLLQCMKVKSESEVAQSCPTLSDPMDCSPLGSSIHGIFQARVLEWGAIAFSVTRNSRI